MRRVPAARPAPEVRRRWAQVARVAVAAAGWAAVAALAMPESEMPLTVSRRLLSVARVAEQVGPVVLQAVQPGVRPAPTEVRLAPAEPRTWAGR